jgi:hypothetical protein
MHLLLLLLAMVVAVIMQEMMVCFFSMFAEFSTGKNWIKCMLLTATLFPGVSFLIAFMLDFIAIYYDSLASIPFGTMVSSCGFPILTRNAGGHAPDLGFRIFPFDSRWNSCRQELERKCR